jgi:mannose-1-phosphate guanylyltransferase/mannose-6-phosphate isomerase
MATPRFHVCVLSGGAGNRLWPLSRESEPKQFHDLGKEGAPLLIDTLRRLAPWGEATVLTSKGLVPGTLGLLQRHGVRGQVLGEPARRNTAAAVALFTTLVLRRDSSGLVGIFPSDQVVEKTGALKDALDRAIERAALGHVLTLGIVPSYPSDAYGYIEFEQKLPEQVTGAELRPVRRFVEKPSVLKAEAFISSGRYVWNAGIFIFAARTMGAHFERLMPEIWNPLQKLKDDLSNLPEIFQGLPSESIDYGIMEKLSAMECVVADLGWSDIGSWEEVVRRRPSTQRVLSVHGGNNDTLSTVPKPRKVAFVGVSDLIAVDTQDALLILKKGDGQRLRDVVQVLKTTDPQLLQSHTFEERPWGRFEVLLDTVDFKSKRITVWPGQKLSYQSHTKRAEHWIIVKGTAEVTLNGEKHRLAVGEHIHIPLGAKHRMANPGTEQLEFIEVQTGTYFGEDDITRYEDDYGRV